MRFRGGRGTALSHDYDITRISYGLLEKYVYFKRGFSRCARPLVWFGPEGPSQENKRGSVTRVKTMIDCRPISRIAMKTPDPFSPKPWRLLLIMAAAAFFGLESASGAPFAGRSLHTAVWTGNEMIVWGGDGPGVYLNDGARYDPAANHWTTVSLSGAAAGRDSFTAVWTGSAMIVWGGWGSLGASTGPI